MAKSECSSYSDPSNRYSDIGDKFPDGYNKDSEDFVDSGNNDEQTPKLTTKSHKEFFPTIFMNHFIEPEVSEIVDDQDRMMDDPILKKVKTNNNG